jgi:hypothetical protein
MQHYTDLYCCLRPFNSVDNIKIQKSLRCGMLPVHKAALKIRRGSQKKIRKTVSRLKERENFGLNGFCIGRDADIIHSKIILQDMQTCLHQLFLGSLVNSFRGRNLLQVYSTMQISGCQKNLLESSQRHFLICFKK